MVSQKSIMHPRVEELGVVSPSSSSPLRRRSNIAQNSVTTSIEENDDEAEIQNRRLENNPPKSIQSNDKRRSLGLSFVSQLSNPQIAEKVQQCIQLNAENKINLKNAFSLQMIDFMSYMIKKQDSTMNNLQVASTSLDVSTKIYGLRVDSVHNDIVKMSGGIEKQDKNDGRRDDTINENGNTEETETNVRAQERAKRKKKRKQNIIANVESLRGPIETINPASTIMGIGDTQTTDMLYLATMPYHANRGLDLHLNSDIVLDVIDPEDKCNLTRVSCPKITNLRALNICASLTSFEILGWSIDDEPEESSSIEPTPIDNGFHFDLDASLPAESETTNAGMNFFDIEDDEDIEGCERIPQTAANIVDFREIIKATTNKQNFEYSYFQDNMDIQWAGPSHWKIRNISKNLTGSRVVGRCDQEPLRRKKEFNLAYNNDLEDINSKFEESRNLVKLQTKTVNKWYEDKITLPQNMQYIVCKTCEYYLIDRIKNFSKKSDMNATHVSDDIGNYDYDNEHDTTDYCPNIGCDDQPENSDNNGNNDCAIEENVGVCTQAFMGDNLVDLPKMANEVNIAFTQRAKKIDMRQLKKCIWKNLININTPLPTIDEQNVNAGERSEEEKRENIYGTVAFSTVFEELPKTLSKNNVEALSLPIAFISLLHLANEKNLQINSNEDQSDLFIRQG